MSWIEVSNSVHNQGKRIPTKRPIPLIDTRAMCIPKEFKESYVYLQWAEAKRRKHVYLLDDGSLVWPDQLAFIYSQGNRFYRYVVGIVTIKAKIHD